MTKEALGGQVFFMGFLHSKDTNLKKRSRMLHEQTLILGQVNDLLIQERSLTVTGGGRMQKILAATPHGQ